MTKKCHNFSQDERKTNTKVKPQASIMVITWSIEQKQWKNALTMHEWRVKHTKTNKREKKRNNLSALRDNVLSFRLLISRRPWAGKKAKRKEKDGDGDYIPKLQIATFPQLGSKQWNRTSKHK